MLTKMTTMTLMTKMTTATMMTMITMTTMMTITAMSPCSNLPPTSFPHCEYIECGYFVHAGCYDHYDDDVGN